MRDSAVTRRGFLSLVGAGALAGCSTLENATEEDVPEINTYGLPDIEDGEEPATPVPPTVPVDIEAAYLDEGRSRTTELLSTLPTALGPDDIPNGHVRGHLTTAAADARSNLDEALRSPTDLSALQSLRQAREHARYAAEGWAFVTEGRTVPSSGSSAARSSRRPVRSARDTSTSARTRSGPPSSTR
ncbi:hypothetical protein ACFQL1_04045 [Halomicroarcula sp. GCM10025709]|uniref:hypothetical protein n=1 Tax=Halomicroarcula sp. GCM10025709 TaxID=3252669 RepID=UPI00360FA6A7